jgi:hypothetical protein
VFLVNIIEYSNLKQCFYLSLLSVGMRHSVYGSHLKQYTRHQILISINSYENAIILASTYSYSAALYLLIVILNHLFQNSHFV